MDSCSFRLPQPYDFELSTARFDVYGLDRATLWRDGGIHRVFGGREVRIEAAPGGVDVEPHDAAIEAEVLRFLGLPFDLDGFYAWAESDEIARAARDRSRRLPAAAPAEPVRGARDLDHRAAGLAPVGGRDPEPLHRALRRSPPCTRTPSRRASGSRGRPRTS